MPDLETRVYNNERDIKQLFDRMGKVEDKSSGAWKTIGEQKTELSQVKADVKVLTDKVTSMEVDMKEQKLAMKQQNRMLKVIITLLAVYGVISLGFFIYIWRHDAELAKGIMSFGAGVAGALGA